MNKFRNLYINQNTQLNNIKFKGINKMNILETPKFNYNKKLIRK